MCVFTYANYRIVSDRKDMILSKIIKEEQFDKIKDKNTLQRQKTLRKLVPLLLKAIGVTRFSRICRFAHFART